MVSSFEQTRARLAEAQPWWTGGAHAFPVAQCVKGEHADTRVQYEVGLKLVNGGVNVRSGLLLGRRQPVRNSLSFPCTPADVIAIEHEAGDNRNPSYPEGPTDGAMPLYRRVDGHAATHLGDKRVSVRFPWSAADRRQRRPRWLLSSMFSMASAAEYASSASRAFFSASRTALRMDDVRAERCLLRCMRACAPTPDSTRESLFCAAAARTISSGTKESLRPSPWPGTNSVLESSATESNAVDCGRTI